MDCNNLLKYNKGREPMKQMKTIITLLMMVVMLPMLSQEAHARQDWVNVDGVVGGRIKYDTDTGFILDCDSSVTSANIPNEINGVRIVGVEKSAFASCSKLESVYLPDTILLLEDSVFTNCTALKSVRLPETIKTIPVKTFYNCTALTASSLVIPESVVSIGSSAFYGCKVLTTLVIPDTVTEIGTYAFHKCTMLSHINLPEHLTTIGQHTFGGCTLLTSIYIPASVTSVNDGFANSSLLSDVYYGGTSQQWNSIAMSGNTPLTAAKIHFLSEPQAFVTAYYSQWAKDYVLNAAQAKIIPSSLGEDYTLTISREQICELLVQTVEKKTGLTLPMADASTFTDTTNSSVLKAYNAGIVGGTTATKFSPLETATREQIAVMMNKAILVIEEKTSRSLTTKTTVLNGYDDFSDVSSWAQESVAILANNGVMSGTSNTKLSPKNTTTMEQCLILALNVFKL